MKAKILKKSLTSFLALSLLLGSTEGAMAQDEPLFAVLSSDCTPKSQPCTCFYPQAITKISTALQEREAMAFELAKYKEFSNSMEEKGWYNDSTLYYAALVGTVLLGGVVGYSLGTAK